MILKRPRTGWRDQYDPVVPKSNKIKWQSIYEEDTIISQEYSYDRRVDRIKNYNH
jgi:hypothetical protein